MPALIECSTCHKEISAAATTCPHCGAPTEMKVQRGILWRLRLAIVFTALSVLPTIMTIATFNANAVSGMVIFGGLAIGFWVAYHKAKREAG